MNNMEQIQNFIKGRKSQTCMLLDASAGGTFKIMTEPQVKDMIKNMCLNEYHSKSERSVKNEIVGTPRGMLVVDSHTALLAQIKLLNKKIAKSGISKANVRHVQPFRFDYYGGGHANRRCYLEESSEEAQFSNFHKNNPYSNTYNPGWKDHLYF